MEEKMDDQEILLDALKFHGHRCWASVAGVRVGLAASRALGVKRSGGTQLYGIVETGEEHGGMCFGDGVQYVSGCTFGKGNIRKQPYGKLTFTLIDKATDRAVRVSYKPTLQKQIAESAFMQQRAAGISPDEIPEADQMELVNLVWNAPESDVLTVGQVFTYSFNWLPEVMGFGKCESCGELMAHAYVRIVGDKRLCIPCSGYDR
jgi:formylmethanofuran dehydrogenase subunit E